VSSPVRRYNNFGTDKIETRPIEEQQGSGESPSYTTQRRVSIFDDRVQIGSS